MRWHYKEIEKRKGVRYNDCRSVTNPPTKNRKVSLLGTGGKRDKQAETSLFVSFYPTNNQRNAVLERIFKEIRSIFIPKENPKQSAEDIKH